MHTPYTSLGLLLWSCFVLTHLQAVDPDPAINAPGPPIRSADDRGLGALTAAKLAAMSSIDVVPIYVNRMSASDPNIPWLSVVDADVMSRADSGQILMSLLKRPAHRTLRSGLWHWLTQHPTYSSAPELLRESIILYHSEGKNWDAIKVSIFADFIAKVGNKEQAQLLDLLSEQGGMGVAIAKQRYLNRLNAAAAGPSNGPTLPSAPTTAESEQKALSPSGLAITAHIETPSDTNREVILSYTIKNQSLHPVKLDSIRQPSPFEGYSPRHSGILELSIWSPTHDSVMPFYEQPNDTAGKSEFITQGRVSISEVEIKPGAEVTCQIDLSRYFPLIHEGQYRCQLIRRAYIQDPAVVGKFSPERDLKPGVPIKLDLPNLTFQIQKS